MAFGIGEEDTKTFIRDGVERIGSYKQTTLDIEHQTSTSWHYIKKAYLHAQGLGALAVGITLAIALLKISPTIKGGLSFSIGLGAFLYPCSWFVSALAIPITGKSAIQPSFNWLTTLSLPLFFGGIVLALLILLLSWLDPGLFSSDSKEIL